MMAVTLGSMGYQLVVAWGNWAAVGRVFVTVMTVTTLIALIVLVPGKARAWCAFCPAGTFGRLLNRRKDPLHVSSACTSCGTCEKVCPFNISPPSYLGSGGVVKDKDCLACSRCVEQCPEGALAFTRAE
jgi:ferredoxin